MTSNPATPLQRLTAKVWLDRLHGQLDQIGKGSRPTGHAPIEDARNWQHCGQCRADVAEVKEQVYERATEMGL